MIQLMNIFNSMSIHDINRLSYCCLVLCGVSTISTLWIWFAFNINKAIRFTIRYKKQGSSSTAGKNNKVVTEKKNQDEATTLLEETILLQEITYMN